MRRKLIGVFILAITLLATSAHAGSFVKISKHSWGVDIKNTTDDVVYFGYCMTSSTCGNKYATMFESECFKEYDVRSRNSWKFFARLKWLRIEAGERESLPGCGCRGAAVNTWSCNYKHHVTVKGEDSWRKAQGYMAGMVPEQPEKQQTRRRQPRQQTRQPVDANPYILITEEPASAMTQAFRNATAWPWGKSLSKTGIFVNQQNGFILTKANQKGKMSSLMPGDPDKDINVVEFHYRDGVFYKMVIKHPGKLPMHHKYAKAKPLPRRYITHGQANYCKYLTEKWIEMMGGARFEYAERVEKTVDGVKYDITFDCNGWVVLTLIKDFPKRTKYLRQAFTVPEAKGWEFSASTPPPEDYITLRNWPGEITMRRNLLEGVQGNDITKLWTKIDFMHHVEGRIREWGYSLGSSVHKVWKLDIGGVPVWYTEGMLYKNGKDPFWFLHYTALLDGARYDIEFYIDNNDPDMQRIVKEGKAIIMKLKLNSD